MAMTEAERARIQFLAKEHENACSYPRCFVKDKCCFKYVCVKQSIAAGEGGDVPEGLRPGHGLEISLPMFKASQIREKNNHSAHCLVFFRGGNISVRCNCEVAEPHGFVFDLACDEYNCV